MAIEDRECAVCGLTKPLDLFPPHNKKGYFKRTCRECHNAQKKLYKQSTPESYLYTRLNTGKRVGVNLTKADLKDMWDAQQGKCLVTGMHMTYASRPMRDSTGLNASVDRIDQSKGYEKGNVRLVCYRVNLMRHTGEDGDLLWWCKQIIEGIEGE